MSQGYLEFPNIDPVLVSIGPVSVRWYIKPYQRKIGRAHV